MFQAWLVKMRKTAAASTPRAEPWNRRMKKKMAAGKKPRIGTACSTSSAGRIRRRPRGEAEAQ
jgi:hypothetical protein